MMNRWIALGPLLLAACNGAGGSRNAGGEQSNACDAALAYIDAQAQTRGPSIVVTASDEQFEHLRTDVASRQFSAGPVPVALLNRLLATKGKSALTACPALGGQLVSRGIAHERDGKPHPIERIGAGKESYAFGIIGVSLPVVSDDGSEALLGASSVVGPEAGSGMIVRLRRQPGGGWKIVDQTGTWIS